jgi:hypothetical protein
MKKVFKSFLAVILFLVAFNVTLTDNCKANTKSSKEISSQKLDLIIVKTVEGDRTYINIYTDSGIFISKMEEL